MGNVKGIYNNAFNDISKDRETKKIIFNLWPYCYNQLKIKVWIKRCEKVAEIEQKKGLAEWIKESVNCR